MHKPFLERTFMLAVQAREIGNHPFAALLVYNDEIIAEAQNSVVTEDDITAHAELNLVRNSTKKFSKDILSKSTLYTSTEPCAMCAGAIYWSGIRKVVFALPATSLGELTNGSLVIPCETIFKHGRKPTKIEGPFCIEEAKKVHLGFWND